MTNVGHPVRLDITTVLTSRMASLLFQNSEFFEDLVQLSESGTRQQE